MIIDLVLWIINKDFPPNAEIEIRNEAIRGTSKNPQTPYVRLVESKNCPFFVFLNNPHNISFKKSLCGPSETV